MRRTRRLPGRIGRGGLRAGRQAEYEHEHEPASREHDAPGGVPGARRALRQRQPLRAAAAAVRRRSRLRGRRRRGGPLR